MSIKTKVAVSLFTLALASATFAQTTIYWSGNEDRWGGNGLTPLNNDNWSTTPGGTTYSQLQGGNIRHMVYDQNNMVGSSSSILINRQSVEMLSVTMYGTGPSSGFGLVLTTNVNNNFGIRLSGPLTVNSGQHSWTRDQEAPHNSAAAVFTLTADSTWDVAANASMLWAIPFTNNSFGITKQGEGTLAFAGDQFYTGDTLINAGAFGAFGGNVSLSGNLSLAAGAKLLFSDAYTLTLASGKQAAFGALGIADLVGLSSSVADGTYTLISGDVDFTNVGNVGVGNAYDLGSGKSAYFQLGSLQVVVFTVPEPSVFALASLGLTGLLIFRRRVVG